jgi:transglutaminase-like putative cysteine protease
MNVGAFGATEPSDKPDEEIWEAAQVDGVKVGYYHTTIQSLDGDGGKRIRVTVEMDLTFKRNNATVQLHTEHGDEETPDGAVVGVFMRQNQGNGKPLVLSGAMEDGRMHVAIDGGRVDRRLRWSDQVVGVSRLRGLFAEKKPKPGDRFPVLTYQPTVNALVPVNVAVKDAEDVPTAGGKKSLLRVDLTPEKIEGSGISVQLPGETWWLDGDFVPQRRQVELEGLGAVVLTRTTRDEAKAAGAPGKVVDLNQKTLIPLNQSIPHPHSTRAAVYKITLRDDPEPQTAFVSDGHQEVTHVKDGTFELHVHPVRLSDRRTDAPEAPAEYLASCHYIDCDDARVQELARKAVGDETDRWKKALRIEKWVKQNLRVDNAAAMCPASQTARDLRGDCRHAALLTAALCRAAGVPARTAVGLIYVEKGGQKPSFGFHLWAEAYVGGQWLGLDGTLGQGGVGAAHLKVADHSWRDVESLTPLLPVSRILGKTAVEVVSVEAGD